MFKLSAKTKKETFEFTDKDDTVNNLYISVFTIEDTDRLIEQQKPLMDEKQETIQILDFNISRIICSVKKVENDEYYWESIQDFKDKNYPLPMYNELFQHVDKLNPINNLSLEGKKKKS